MMKIGHLVVNEAENRVSELASLLKDAVDNGASVGYIAPMALSDAEQYWRDVIESVSRRERILLVAEHEGRIVGTVQLVLESRPNGNHRGEVSKLLVHTEQRRRGIGRALMLALEEDARKVRRILLVLDTVHGDSAEQLYRSIGYQEAGVIPEYARSSAGPLEATVYMYKRLPEDV